MKVAVCSRSFSRHPVLRAELLERYPETTFNDEGLSLKGSTLIDFLRGHAATIIGLEVIDEAVLAALPELKVVSKYGVGVDMLDLAALERREVGLGWTAGVNRRSVAELVVAFAIALLHRVPSCNQEVRSGTWKAVLGRELTGATVGLVGFGHVARDVAKLLGPFDCRLLVHDLVAPESMDLDQLLAQSDVVSLHLPLTEETRGLLDERRLRLMKAGAVLINTARGGLVDEDALKRLLQEGHLAGAGFDVFAAEPTLDLELVGLPNFLATPHIGSSTAESILAMGRAAIAGVAEARRPSELGLYVKKG